MGQERRRGGASGGYGRDNYHANGHRSAWDRESERYNEEWPSNGRDGHYGRDVPAEASKYDDYDPKRGNGRRGVGAEENGNGGRSGRSHAQDSHSQDTDGTIPEALVASLEKKITSAHAEMTQELNAITGKENEKFDLIFGILIELQRRQAQLEESVRSIKAQLPGGGGMMPQQGQQGNQTNGQMFMPNQMNMGQQYGNMGDGSQAYFGNQNVVLVAQPMGMAPPQGAIPVGQSMQQMPYAMPQMMQGPMQPQMAMQFVGQDQSGGNYQWAGADNSQESSNATGTGTQDQTGTMEPTETTPKVPEDGTSAPEESALVAADSAKAAGDEDAKAEVRIEKE
jgi:hypothetical protein